MKGLFNYETALREYIRALIADFVSDGITYAEIKTVFTGNTWMRDDALSSLTVDEVCDLIEQEIAAAKANPAIVPPGSFFQGFRLIYCLPKIRLSPTYITDNMNECIRLKLAYPDLICGKHITDEAQVKRT